MRQGLDDFQDSELTTPWPISRSEGEELLSFPSARSLEEVMRRGLPMTQRAPAMAGRGWPSAAAPLFAPCYACHLFHRFIFTRPLMTAPRGLAAHVADDLLSLSFHCSCRYLLVSYRHIATSRRRAPRRLFDFSAFLAVTITA